MVTKAKFPPILTVQDWCKVTIAVSRYGVVIYSKKQKQLQISHDEHDKNPTTFKSTNSENSLLRIKISSKLTGDNPCHRPKTLSFFTTSIVVASRPLWRGVAGRGAAGLRRRCAAVRADWMRVLTRSNGCRRIQELVLLMTPPRKDFTDGLCGLRKPES